MKDYIEIVRHDVTPKQFWNYCKMRVNGYRGLSFDESVWLSFEEWSDESQSVEDYRETGKIYRCAPYMFQSFEAGQWNMIIEYDFSNDAGYMYFYLKSTVGV